MANLLIRTWRQAEMGAFPTGDVHEGLKEGIRVFLAIPSLESFVDPAEIPHFQQKDLKRHYDELRNIATLFSSGEKGAAQQGAAAGVARRVPTEVW